MQTLKTGKGNDILNITINQVNLKTERILYETDVKSENC